MKNYSKIKYKFVSIARFNKIWNGEIYPKLFPPTEVIKIEDEKLYTKLYYEQVLNKLNPKEVYEELGENAVLLCYESWDSIKSGKATCHRRIVAKWLEDSLGITVEELGNESKNKTEQLRF